MKPIASILYEDESAGGNNFGPHVLVCRCVLDRLDWPDERLRDVRNCLSGKPKKGVGNLIKACADAKEARGYHWVFAVFDDDRVREHLRMQNACKTKLRASLMTASPFQDQLRVVLLERNLETVVDAVLKCRGKPSTPRKPKPLERDSILLSIVWGDPSARSVRDCVMSAVPSFAYLVNRIAPLVDEYARAVEVVNLLKAP